MKKALTVFVEDNVSLGNICATFVCWNTNGQSSVTMLNEKIPKGAAGIYLPWKTLTNKTEWVLDTRLPEIKDTGFNEWNEPDAQGRSIGRRIKQRLAELGRTQSWLAKRSKMTSASICRYVSSERVPSATAVISIAHALGVSPNWLMGWGEEAHNESD